MTVTVRVAAVTDAVPLAELAALTFPLACPPHTTADAQASFIAEMLSANRFAGYIGDADRVVLVAEDVAGGDAAQMIGNTMIGNTMIGNAMIGYTIVVVGEPHDGAVAAAITARPSAELSKCYVLPGYHGAGVASMLMDASLTAARGRGAVGIWLGVNEDNARAQRFYAKHGFEIVGNKHFTVGDRLEDDYVLERVL